MKFLHLKVNGDTKEIVDWNITIDELVLLKGVLATANGITQDDIEVVVLDAPERSDQIFLDQDGKLICRPNPYALNRLVEGLRFSYYVEDRSGCISDEGLEILLEKISSGNVADVICFK